MAQVSKLLSDKVLMQAELGLKRLGKYGVIASRLQIIIAAKKHGITNVCNIHGISRTTLTDWIKRLAKEGKPEALANQPKKPKSPLTQHVAIIKKWIEENSNITANELTIMIDEKLGVEVSTSSVYRLMERLKFSYITPRPKHYKQKEGSAEEFKKNLAQKIKDNNESEIFFFDEARFGTHSKLGHGWYPKGSRTQVKVKLGYKNFYLYGAVNPSSGKHVSLILPSVNTICMNIFLQELAVELGNTKIILVMDGAGWHKSNNLIVPDNITLAFLPPYSPELNPIERLWLHIKHHTIRNRIYKTLNELQKELCRFIQNMKMQVVASICAVNYLSSYM